MISKYKLQFIMTPTESYEWTEDENSITIVIPFRGKSLKRTELVIIDSLVKVSHPSYRLEIYLERSINDSLSRAIITDDSLIIYLCKERPGIWDTLEFSGTKEECEERRRASLLRQEERNQLRHQNAKIKKRDEERSTVRSQVRAMFTKFSFTCVDMIITITL